MTARAVNPNDFSTYAEAIGASRVCAACGSTHEVVEIWVSGADQFMCRECSDAWLRFVWPEIHGPLRGAA